MGLEADFGMVSMVLELYWGVLLGLPLVQEKELERSRTGQREKLGGAVVSKKAFAHVKGGSEAGMALLKCPKVQRGGWAFMCPW